MSQHDEDKPLLLYEREARAFGVSEADIAAAKTAPQPCPKEWPVAQSTWRVITPIPMHVGRWSNVRFVERKRGRRK